MSIFHGLSAFPLTPADAAGRVDTGALSRLVQRLVEARVGSVSLLGSTGTYAYLSRAERRRAVEAAADCTRGRTLLVVGVGALRTDAAQLLARDAEAAGADGLLLAPVSYTPLTEDEVFAHVAAVAGATGLPLCLYNNPATTHFTMTDALVARLAALPRVAAVKNPAPPMDEAARHAALRALVPADFAIGYSGDWRAGAALLAGGQAWYSVIGGLLPEPSLALTNAALAGETAQVAALDARFAPLWALFQEWSSLRVTHAAARIMGLCDTALPLPIQPLPSDLHPRIEAALDALA